MNDNLNITNCDPAWDYASIAEMLLSIDETRKELGEILTSDQAENGNLNTDHQILAAVAKIKGDCEAITKAIDATAGENSKPSTRWGSSNLSQENSLESISENLRQACGYLARISIKLSDISRQMPEQ